MRSVQMRWAVLGVLGMLLVGCGGEPQTDPEQAAVATVNGTPITVEAFEEGYVAYLIQTGQNDTPAHRYGYLDNLIDTHLLAEEARRRGFDRDSAYQAFEIRARKKALGGAFFKDAFLTTLPPPTDAEIRQAFARWKQQVVVRHLFYRSEAEAWAAHARLEAGHDFLEEAQDCYDLAAFDSTAGYLGPVRYFQVEGAFAEAAFALDVGAYSEPVRTRRGYHIIRVEDKHISPLLTESEYQTRKAGIASQWRLQHRQQEGDAFVRSYMEARDVQVEPQAIQALALAIEDLEHTAQPEMGPLLDEGVGLDRDALRAMLTPETVLATYAWQGERHPFTAAMYYFWLEDLPFHEARHRTAASVGRALRNEVFAREGAHRELDGPEVEQQVARQTRRYLAAHLRRHLRANPPDTVSDAFRQAAYERLGGDPPETQVTFWVIPFETMAAARAARERLARRPASADTYASYRHHEQVPADAVATWGYYAERAPLQQPVVVGTGEAWGVLFVAQREQVAAPEPQQPARTDALKPYAGEYELVKTLRADATAVVDTVLFEQRMAWAYE